MALSSARWPCLLLELGCLLMPGCSARSGHLSVRGSRGVPGLSPCPQDSSGPQAQPVPGLCCQSPLCWAFPKEAALSLHHGSVSFLWAKEWVENSGPEGIGVTLGGGGHTRSPAV